MRKSVLIFCALFLLILINSVYASNTLRTFSGKVVAVDPSGKAIVVSEMVGKSEMVVGVIVTQDTEVKIGNKKAEIKDLKVGDRVTVTYERTNDLYAKKIVKK